MFKTYVINLERSTERLARITDRLHQADLPFERVAAVDGRLDHNFKSLGYSEFKNRLDYGRKLTKGEIGCYASHLRALRKFIETGEDYCLILEDDATFSPLLKTKLDLFLTTLKSVDFYCLNLCNMSKYNTFEKTPHKELHCVNQAIIFPTLATGLVWSRQGAEEFVKHASIISMPYDQMLRDWLTKNGMGYAIDKSIIQTEGLESDIGGGVRRSEQSMIDGLLYDIIRAKRDTMLTVHFIRNWSRSILKKYNARYKLRKII